MIAVINIIGWYAIFGLFMAMLTFLLFGQITLRRLRKNKKVKKLLGFDFVNGVDIFIVAFVLSIPRSWGRRIDSGPLSFFYANSEALYKHTSRFDRFLGRIFYGLLSTSLLSLLVWGIYEHFGKI
jgi:hypothetical protein